MLSQIVKSLQASLVLAACLLVTLVPACMLRAALCLCPGDSATVSCCCTAAEPEPTGSCCSEGSDQDPVEDPCCVDLELKVFSGNGETSGALPANGDSPDWASGAPPLLGRHAAAWPAATGPPTVHEDRARPSIARALAERASVLLLI